MQYRPFGSTELTVSEIGVGCARIGGLFQVTSRPDQLRLLRAALDAGITFYDTADMYAQGESERLLGEAFARDRDKVVIASKVGYRFAPPGGLISRIKPLVKPIVNRLGLKRQRMPTRMLSTVSAQDFSGAYITAMLEGTLRRLKSEYVDICQLHSPPPQVLERGEFVTTLERLKEQGKIRYWGIACENPEDVAIALRSPAVRAIQISVSLLHPESLDTAIPHAAARGVGVIARQVFASGLLTRSGAVLDDARADQIASHARAAEQRGSTLGAYALRFVLDQPGVSVALLGMHHPRHLHAALEYVAGAEECQRV